MTWDETISDIIIFFLKWLLVLAIYKFSEYATNRGIIDRYGSVGVEKIIGYCSCALCAGVVAFVIIALSEKHNHLELQTFILYFGEISIPAFIGMYMAFEKDKKDKKNEG